MEFIKLKKKLQTHVNKMLEDQEHLFVVDTDKDTIWNTYLDSFPEGTNEIYRERREYDCSCCKHFIRSFGNVVIIKDNKVKTIWDFTVGDSTYDPVLKALSSYVSKKAVEDIFVTKEIKFGTDSNRELLENGQVQKWEHFYIVLPTKFATKSHKSEANLMGDYRSIKEVFKRSLDEINQDAVETVLELIAQKSLYKGEEWKSVLESFLDLQKEYSKLKSVKTQDLYCWTTSMKVGPVIGKIRNHSIGTLLINISEGMDLDEAVRKYEAIVAPTNYKRPKAIFTKKMLEQAQKTVEELGLMDSLGRRHAMIEDIRINNILFANKDAAKRMAGNVFEEMQEETSAVNPKSFAKVEEVSIETFVKDVLPTAKNIEALFENRHTSNLVTLIAPKVGDSKPLFKWDNGFSWAYNGNITDSMKERVKAFGGKVDGVLRFSIQWNDKADTNDDFDAHCVEPNGHRIYFANKINARTTGHLDVDIRMPGKRIAVENITWTDKSKMLEGKYTFLVNNYDHRGGLSGFTAEIECDGQIHTFHYPKALRQKENVVVANIEFNKKGGIKLIKSLESTTASKEIWSIQTSRFLPVSVCMFSPNYWDEQKGIGNKHYFFMLNGCKTDDRPNGFFNEFLQQDLMEHKRVFEALAAKMRVEKSDNQLSGLGFSSTKRNSLVVKVEGKTTRTIKLIF